MGKVARPTAYLAVPDTRQVQNIGVNADITDDEFTAGESGENSNRCPAADEVVQVLVGDPCWKRIDAFGTDAMVGAKTTIARGRDCGVSVA